MSTNKMKECFGLTTGTTFTAKNKLGQVHRYRFQGIDLDDLKNGAGCRYIVLKDLDDDANYLSVEAAWFAERTITILDDAPSCIKPKSCAGYTVIETAKVGDKELLLCQRQDGNCECPTKYIVWDAANVGNVFKGQKCERLESALEALYGLAHRFALEALRMN